MIIDFYEKPGCINNTKQKLLLSEKGYNLHVHNIFTEKWTKERLIVFFAGLPVSQWFNYSAPRIKSGEINPQSMNIDEALTEMISDNYLIKRPLLYFNNNYVAGFDNDLVNDLLHGADVSNILSCPNINIKEKCGTVNTKL